MKKWIAKITNTAKDFFKWVWMECKDWRTIVLLGIVCAVLGLPVWCGYLLGLLFDWGWAYLVATVTWGIWMLPGAPFFALSVSITLAIKRLYEKRIEKRRARKNEE